MTYTHGHAESVLASHRVRGVADSAAYLVAELRGTDRLLDVGSGPGTITAELAGLVAEVVAVEATAEAVDLTRRELERQAVANASVVQGDVHDLDLPDGCFDVVHAHQVLQHLVDPVAALREMLRVCRRGGLVAARDADYSAFAWWPRLPELDRWMELYQRAARANGGEPDAGRRLLGWARDAGALEVSATSTSWFYATDATRRWWGEMWAERIVSSRLAAQLLDAGWSDRAELEQIAAAWRTWSLDAHATFLIPHGEILVRKG